VPGEDLAARLSRGPLPVDEAIEVCRQIAEGLEVAHEAGVVHRDLKPANVRITPDGVVKILDFGLAKPIRPRADEKGTTTAQSDSFLMTEEGLVLGTPTYMSPEQARGKAVDRRTDIWAFGCVLYECLSGQRAFRGESFTDVLAAIVGEEPDWSKLPELPARVSELLVRTLTKDPRERLRDIGEARMQLALATTGSGVVRSGPMRSRGSGNAIRGTALVLVGAAAGFALAQLMERSAAVVPTEAVRTEERDLKMVLHTFEPGEVCKDLAISPTAWHVAWSDQDGLRVRGFDALESRLLHEGEVGNLTWSPGGEEVAFSVDKILSRMSIDDGRTTLIARHDEDINKILWVGDDVYFRTEVGIYSVHQGGGAIELRASVGEGAHMHGFGLHPDGIVGVVHPVDGDADTISLHEDGVWTPILQVPESYLFFHATRPNGALLYGNAMGPSDVWVVPPGWGTEEGGSDPVPVPVGAREVSFADDGTAAYILDGRDPFKEPAGAQPCWFHLDGSVTPIANVASGTRGGAHLSPGHRRILLTSWDGPGDSDVRVHDVERGLTTPFLSFDQPVLAHFLPDGRVAITRLLKNLGTLVYAPSGKGDPEILSERALKGVSDDSSVWVWSDKPFGGELQWSTDEHASDLRPLLGPGEEADFLDFSRDGAWMLYSSRRTGEKQVYMTRFPPERNEEWPVSGPGCDQAWFLEDQSAILFVDDGEPRRVLRVSFEARPEVRLGAPEPVFELEGGVQLADFDGVDRFLGTTSEPPGRRHLVISTEWREQLR
jgi:hypothetical protein